MSYIHTLFSIERGYGLALIDDRKHIAPLVAALPAIVAAVGSVAGAVMNKKSNDKNNALQQQLVDKANAYNTPSSQVERFRNAGLNPYMMLGQVNAGNQQSVATTQPTDYSGVVNGAASAASSLIQGLTAQSEITKNEADARNVNADTVTKNIRNVTELERNKAELQKQLSEASKNDADRDKIRKEIDLVDEQITQLKQINDIGLLTWDERIKAPGVQNQLNAAQAALLGSQKKGADLNNNLVQMYGAANMRAMIGKAAAEARAADASADYARAGIPKVVSEGVGQILKNKGQKIVNAVNQVILDYKRDHDAHPKLDYWMDKLLQIVGVGQQQAKQLAALLPMVM